ncbi:MAG TPA: RNB domain-containing ribonuclease [Propionibacteriaceae bacterium]|nr:RNB domain-containing ribonuclease [Propionibacteriaceae bacterium]
MPAVHFATEGDVPAPIREGVRRLREALEVPSEFPADVLAAAEEAATSPSIPALDRTDIEFVTIDPEGSMDLDQALHIERSGSGYVVHYAIADVGAWVEPSGAIDTEARLRGQTLYAPDWRAALHPPRLSEDAASLLADGTPRPAQLWTITLDSDGVQTDAQVERAMVQSRAKLTYTGVQADLNAGRASESLQLLKTVGELRLEVERERGGVSLEIPEQEVESHGDDWALHFRTPLPVEGWNAQISLLTGGAAAQIMLEGEVGLLRTLPPAEQYSIDKLRRTAKALDITWPGAMTYPELVRSLDPTKPTHLAMMNACTLLFRGAGYLAFDGAPPEGNIEHGALAMPYAHVTAPLRRLVDRFAGEICVSLCAGEAVPDWVRGALPELPKLMGASDSRAKKYERGIVDLLEALVLSGHRGKTFTGVVVDYDPGKQTGIVHLKDLAVESFVRGRRLELGEEERVRVVEADLTTGRTTFEAAG